MDNFTNKILKMRIPKSFTLKHLTKRINKYQKPYSVTSFIKTPRVKLVGLSKGNFLKEGNVMTN